MNKDLGRLQPIVLNSYKPLREVVCETLRQAIRDGVFKPGERLMEVPLAEELGVSRTPVREAIRKLELEGFVVMIPHRGTYVADISLKDVTQVFEIRSALEELAAQLAAERITPDEIEFLERMLVEIGTFMEEKIWTKWWKRTLTSTKYSIKHPVTNVSWKSSTIYANKPCASVPCR